MSVAVVTVVAGRHDRLRAQRAGLLRGDRRPDRHVVVAMADRAVAAVVAEQPDLPTTVVDVDRVADRMPLAAARNAGAAAAMADLLVFLDVDVVPAPALLRTYVDGLAAHPGSVLSGPVAYLPEGVVDPDRFADHPFHPARPAPTPGTVVPMTDPQLFWSLSFGLDAEAWGRIGGFDEAYSGYGGEDTDFARRAVRAGVPLAWLGGAAGYHLHHPVSAPPVEHLDDILRNGRLFRDRWGSWPMTGWLTAFERLGLVERHGEDWVRAG